MYASVPSCVTFASTTSNLLFDASVIDMKYLALLDVLLSNVFKTVVAELDTVVVASTRSEWLSVAPAVANERVPAPSVFINWLVLPSVVGKVKPLMVTPPVPFPDNSRLALEEFVLTNY